MSWALYIGRFQPFHKGHLYAIDYLLKREKGIVIAIGSCMNSHESVNPFTFGERLMMIIGSLDEANIPRKRWYSVGVPDVKSHSVWVETTKALSPSFSTVYSNDPLTKILFKESNYKVKGIPLYNKQIYSGTEIRRRMSLGEEWCNFVPKATVKVIKEIKGEERIRTLYR